MSSYFYDLICEIFMMSSLFTLHKVTSARNIPGPWEGLLQAATWQHLQATESSRKAEFLLTNWPT